MAYIDVSLHSLVSVRLSDDLAVNFGSCFRRHCGGMGMEVTYTGGLQFRNGTLEKLDGLDRDSNSLQF